MGYVEKKVKKRAKKQNIRYAVLVSIKIAGMLSVAAIAPNALQLLSYTSKHKNRNHSKIYDSLTRLESKGYVKKSKYGSYLLTKKGDLFLTKMSLHEYTKKQKNWDGKWRVAIFDIPERRKLSRDQLRLALVSIGFKRLQNSVWIYPYDCEDLLMLLKTDYRLGMEVQYMVVEEVENDLRLRKWFKLT